MQVIYGPGNASNVLLTAQKRLIRPLYAQSQGYPYACSLDSSLRNTDGSIRLPLNADSFNGYTRTAAGYTYQGSLIPGLVLAKTTGEYVTVHNGGTSTPFGLLGQWIGGTFDNVGQSNQVGAWMGPDSVYELLAPAWNDTTVSAAVAAAGTGSPVPLYAGADGRLTSTNSGSQVVVATVMDRPSSARLVIKLAI